MKMNLPVKFCQVFEELHDKFYQVIDELHDKFCQVFVKAFHTFQWKTKHSSGRRKKLSLAKAKLFIFIWRMRVISR